MEADFPDQPSSLLFVKLELLVRERASLIRTDISTSPWPKRNCEAELARSLPAESATFPANLFPSLTRAEMLQT